MQTASRISSLRLAPLPASSRREKRSQLFLPRIDYAEYAKGVSVAGARLVRYDLAGGIFPIPRLAFGEPGDRGVEAFLTRLVALRFGDPLDVLATMTRTEFLERRRCFRVFLQR